ncbi:MAG: NAD-dependent epimerase/dehydratase family protein [Candidatus Hodarchaeota archaeon]
MKILVTGATGFIGSAFVQALIAKKPKYDIYCAVRSSSNIEVLKNLDVNFVNFDLTDFNSFRPAVEGKDIVVHFASQYKNWDRTPEDVLFSHNVEATQKLAETCLSAKVQHFIYCSTTEALGKVVDGTEESAYNPDEIYGETKMEAEKILLDMQEKRNLPLTIARPTGVTGYGDCYPFLDIILAVDRKLILLPRFLPGSGKGTIHWTDIENIVQGFIKIIEMPEKSIDQIYNLASDRAQTWNEVVKAICNSLGITSSTYHIPVFLARLGVPLFLLYYKVRKVKNFVLYPNSVKKLQTSRSYINTKAKTDLGFNPNIDFESSVENSVSWLKERGLLKNRQKK